MFTPEVITLDPENKTKSEIGKNPHRDQSTDFYSSGNNFGPGKQNGNRKSGKTHKNVITPQTDALLT